MTADRPTAAEIVDQVSALAHLMLSTSFTDDQLAVLGESEQNMFDAGIHYGSGATLLILQRHNMLPEGFITGGAE